MKAKKSFTGVSRPEGVYRQSVSASKSTGPEAMGHPTHQLSCVGALEHFPFSYAGSTALRGTSNGEKPRGLKPAARNTETGNALDQAGPRLGDS